MTFAFSVCWPSKQIMGMLPCSSPEAHTHDWLLINGFWSLSLTFGLLYCAWTLHNARSWRIGPVWLRSFLADYGVVSMVQLG